MTRPPGYLARVGSDDLDSVVFERLVAAARAAARAGRHEHAGQQFRTAEALWHGAAYGGVGESPLAAEAARLEALRLAAVEERVTAEMALGRSAELVGELTALVGAYPTHERLRARLMVVLYRLGRQADALATFHEGRATLANELGIDPGPELRAAHEAILRADPGLLVAAGSPEPAGAGASAKAASPHDGVPLGRGVMVPAQLPAVPADFTGRATEVGHVTARLVPDPAATPAPAGCVIAGAGGSGKSTLALRVAHDVAGEFPDGQLYADLRGTSDTPAEPADVLGRFLRALGTDPATLPDQVDERADVFRTVLSGRRMLVVLDDAANEAQVRPLLPGSAGSAVLVTARRRLPGLAGASHLELEVLTEDEAVVLLGRVAGPERVAAEPDAAARIAMVCGCLPLAIRIAGARLASRGHWTLASMAGRLADERRLLDELSVADQQVRASIQVSYRWLDASARTALRMIGTIGLPDCSAWNVACLLDVPVPDAEDIVERLVDAHLLDFARTDVVGAPRFRIHELVRAFARERTAAEDTPAATAAAVRRLMSTWLWLIDRIGRPAPLGAIPLHPVTLEPSPADPAVAADILAQPRAWLDAEQESFVIAVERAAALNLADVSVALAAALCGSVFAVGNVFEACAHPHAALTATRRAGDRAAWGRTHTAALTAARGAGDRAAEAILLAQLGQLRCEQDRYAESHEHLLDALSIFRELGDHRGEAAVLATIGTVCRDQGRLREAIHFLGLAQTYFRAARDDSALGYAGRLVGATRLEQGDFAGADADLAEALVAYRSCGSRRGEALTLRSLSLVHRAMGQLDEALELSLSALAMFRALGDELLEAYAVQSVAKTLIRLGRGEQALPMLTDALATCVRLGDRWGEAFMLRTRGELHLAAGRLPQAEADLTASVGRWVTLDVPLLRARSERDLATLREAQGDHAHARSLRASAMETFRSCGAREYSEMALTGNL